MIFSKIKFMTDKQFLKKLGKKISQLREEKEISVQNLAEKVDVSRMELYRIEKGEVNSSINVLRRISKELGVDVSELIKI